MKKYYITKVSQALNVALKGRGTVQHEKRPNPERESTFITFQSPKKIKPQLEPPLQEFPQQP